MPSYSGLDGLEYDADPSVSASARPSLGVRASGKYIGVLGQTTAPSTTAPVANQALGTVGNPAIATANTAVTVTVANTLVTANSHVFVTITQRGATAIPNAQMTVVVTTRTAGTSFVISFNCSTTLSVNTVNLQYLIIN